VNSDELLRNIEALHPAPSPILLELERRSGEDGAPIVSRATGRFLSMMVTAMQANRILEVGTSYGYSTLWMALAQPPAGKIWTIDPHVDRTNVARSYFERAGEDDNIEVFNTPPLQLLENFPQRNLDMVFVAAGERHRAEYLELILPMLKLSGMVIFDDSIAQRAFVEAFLAHPALDATLLPLGLAVGARRK
jgi:predicted O-methyltransferase YrrM